MTEREGIVCAGNWIVDIVHDIDHWPNKSELATIHREERGLGGGAANVISAMARMDVGFPLLPFGAIGSDDLGDFVLRSCKILHLPSDHLIRLDHAATAHTHVMSVPGDSRTFFYQGGANDCLSEADFPSGFFSQSSARIFYLGYLMLLANLDVIEEGTTGAAKILARAQAAGHITAVDLVSASRDDFALIVKHASPFIDFLIMNEVEACRAGEQCLVAGDIPSDESLLKAAQRLFHHGVNRAIIIHCPEKAIWVPKDGEPIVMRPKPLPADAILSPVGAGDAFCAGLLYGIHESFAPEAALQLAHATAVASMRGMTATEAIPPLSQLMDRLSYPVTFDRWPPNHQTG